jgi:hypothetical protein
MNRFIATATFAAMLSLAAAPAFAATDASLSTDDAKSLCTTLTSQFDYLKPFKEGLPYWQKASAEFKTGKQDCNKGQAVAGAEAMQSAISDMYVKPDTL